MPVCKFCNQDGLEWYQDSQEKWKLGIKLDINNFRKHICKTSSDPQIKNNKRNWISFTCIECGLNVKQNVKLIKSKTLNLCMDCDNHWQN